MKLSTPKNITFYISVGLAVLAFLGFFVDAMTVFAPWMLLIAFIILAAGNLLEGL
jgi:F0F1-type ATP synthase assembly protein I